MGGGLARAKRQLELNVDLTYSRLVSLISVPVP